MLACAYYQVPELVDDFVERVLFLLADRNHGVSALDSFLPLPRLHASLRIHSCVSRQVLYTGVQLITHLLENFTDDYRKRFQKVLARGGGIS